MFVTQANFSTFFAGNLRVGLRSHFRLARIGRRAKRGRVPRQPKVQNLYPAIFRQHNVFRLQVPMYDPRRMSSGQPVCHLCGNVNQFARWNRPRIPHQQRPERFALDQFAHNILLPSLNAHVMRNHNVGVVQRGHSASLPFKPDASIGAASARFPQHLDCDIAVQPRIPRTINLAHAPGSKRGLDLIMSKPGCGGKHHKSSRPLSQKSR
jgi:hypothetical protein